MLKVWTLKSMLSLVPDDAVVKIRHELVGDDQLAGSLYYEKISNTVWILEMDNGDQLNIDPDNSIYHIEKEV